MSIWAKNGHKNFKLCFCFIPDPKLWSHLNEIEPKHLIIDFQVVTCCFCRKWWREYLGRTERSLFHIHLWAEVEQLKSRWKFNNLPSFGPEIFRESKYTKKPETCLKIHIIFVNRSRPSILCVTRQLSHKKRNYPIGSTVPHEMMHYEVVLGQYMAYIGWYLVVLGQ